VTTQPLHVAVRLAAEPLLTLAAARGQRASPGGGAPRRAGGATGRVAGGAAGWADLAHVLLRRQRPRRDAGADLHAK
jgi:hypothetical protein